MKERGRGLAALLLSALFLIVVLVVLPVLGGRPAAAEERFVGASFMNAGTIPSHPWPFSGADAMPSIG